MKYKIIYLTFNNRNTLTFHAYEIKLSEKSVEFNDLKQNRYKHLPRDRCQIEEVDE